MQQSHPDHHHPQSVQFSNQPMQPHMMLSPVQFIYDPQMLVPPDDHVQPSPTLLNQTFIVNLQNPPPWIQNRTNMVYMSQPYHHQNMVHNPMYNYQYQPVMMQQDQIRHMIPNLMNQNLVQNPQTLIQNPQTMIQNPNMVQHSQNMIQNTQNMMQSPVRFQREIKQELPLLTHMLQNQVLRKPVINQQNDFVAPIQMIRPQYQNVHPQMLTVNPMPSNHTCVHHNSHQKEHQNSVNNEITQKTESPQHVRNQILDINVKTVFKVPITAMVRPTEYAFQNIAPADDAHPRVYHKPVMKHNTTNTEPKPNCKRKIRDMLEQNSKVDSDVQAFKRNCPINKQDIADKIRSQMKTNISKPAINDVAAQNNILNSNRPLVSPKPQNNPVNDRPQKEEKLLRNTVYVQARGRVNEIKNEANNLNMGNAKFDVPIQNDTEINSPAQIALRVSPVPDKEVIPPESNSQNIKEVKITQIIEASGQNNSKITNNKVENLEQTDIKEMMNINDAIKKYVLTHVLDGHIIQESNVPFLVQKPMPPIKDTPNNNPEVTTPSSKETEIISSDNRETDISSNSVKEKAAETDNKRETYEKKEREAVLPKLVKLDFKTVNRVKEDDPFEYVSRSTVKTWTVSDVFSHLNRHNWRESALKLRDEEIDGESLLLVNKDQLLHIGICVNHAEILSTFLQRAQ